MQLQQQDDGQDILVWLADRDTVRNKDTKEHTSLSFMPPILEMSSQLLQEIPLSSAGGDEYTRVTVSSGGPLYWCSNDEVWYMKAILSKNAMRKFFSTAAKNPGLQL